MNLRVVKFGGSLLGPQAGERWEAWRSRAPRQPTIVIVGGGRPVRDLHARMRAENHDETSVHWGAVSQMSVGAEEFARRQNLRWVDCVEELPDAAHRHGCVVFAVHDWLRQTPSLLPESADVTSDSIAAHVAVTLALDEVTLLKSTLPTGPHTLAAWAAQGFVDPYFPTAAKKLTRVRAANLRHPLMPEIAATQ